jgi:KaiC/GvpD/RAD55 family RecA-like ATPase
LDPAAFAAYCDGFKEHPLGVVVDEGGPRPLLRRSYGAGSWPEIFGEVPQLAAILRRAFAAPLGIPGLEEVLGGLQPAFLAEHGAPGIVTLLAGPPGSGKTTLALAIASVLAELGTVVRFLAAEESVAAIDNKLASQFWSTPASLWSQWAPEGRTRRGDFGVIELERSDSLGSVVRRLEADLDDGHSPIEHATFGRAIVIDSLGAVLKPATRGKVHGARAFLRDYLQRLRDTGVCVFLTASAVDEDQLQVDYLVDNVVRLGLETDASGRHTTRVLALEKTRMQYSHGGRHVLHISAGEGCSVSPSLHSVMREIKTLEVREPSATHLFELPVGGETVPGEGVPTMREGSHILIYGQGSTNKARLALTCALAPSKVGNHDRVASRQNDKGDVPLVARPRRTLVVSFLYSEAYYRKQVKQVELKDQEGGKSTVVWSLYPGFVNAETFVARLRKYLDTAELEGLPFESLVIDGIHNLILEFPLLQADELLWPCVFRIARTRGIRTVCTFTFFDVGADHADVDGRIARDVGARSFAQRTELFFHMLVSGCDYSFDVNREFQPRGSTITVRVANSSSMGLRVGDMYRWLPAKGTLHLLPRPKST